MWRPRHRLQVFLIAGNTTTNPFYGVRTLLGYSETCSQIRSMFARAHDYVGRRVGLSPVDWGRVHPIWFERALLSEHTTSKQGKMNFLSEIPLKNYTKTHLPQPNVYGKH